MFYSDNNNWFAAWAYWLATYFGHPRSQLRLMNGGRAKWIAEKRPLSTETAHYPAKQYTAKSPSADVRALRDYVIDAVKANRVGLVDVRSPREFSGELLAPENLPQEGVAAWRAYSPRGERPMGQCGA